MDHLQQVQMLNTRFVRPPDFDPAAYLAQSIAAFPRGIPVEVLLHTDIATAAEELGKYVGLLTPHENAVLLHTQTESLTWFARQLARLRCTFEIRAPEELREAVRAHAQHLLRIVD